MNIIFPSKEKLDAEKQTFSLLPQDDYTLKIVSVERKTQNKYKSEDVEEVVNVKLEVVSLKDGEKAVDDEGELAVGRLVFFTARPESSGFMKDGTASKTRCLVAYATGQDVLEDINIEAWEELLGKNINAEIIQKPNEAGEKRNRISRFLISRKKNKKDDDIPIIEDKK